jgi:hypothetical protein
MPRPAKLTDIQLILLTTASQRKDGSLLPPPDGIGGQAQRIRTAVTALLKCGFAEEVDAADSSRSWHEEGERRIGAVITDAGRTVIGAEVLPIKEESTSSHPGVEDPTTIKPDERSGVSPAFTARADTKQALVIDLLQRTQGASITELAEATGWLPHTTRAALTGLRKRGLTIAREKIEGVGRYRAPSARAR